MKNYIKNLYFQRINGKVLALIDSESHKNTFFVSREVTKSKKKFIVEVWFRFDVIVSQFHLYLRYFL